MAELKCPCHLRDDMDWDDCDEMDCNECCPLTNGKCGDNNALREQEERSKGCEYCRESENIYYHAGEVNALDELLYITGDDLVVDIGCSFYLAASIKFCPMCGRRLEEV